jgi:hypothetical protein
MPGEGWRSLELALFAGGPPFGPDLPTSKQPERRNNKADSKAYGRAEIFGAIFFAGVGNIGPVNQGGADYPDYERQQERDPGNEQG